MGGYVEIPWKTIYGVAVPRRYTFGLFMHGTTASNQTIASASNKAMQAILRAEITKALEGWLQGTMRRSGGLRPA